MMYSFNTPTHMSLIFLKVYEKKRADEYSFDLILVCSLNSWVSSFDAVGYHKILQDNQPTFRPFIRWKQSTLPYLHLLKRNGTEWAIRLPPACLTSQQHEIVNHAKVVLYDLPLFHNRNCWFANVLKRHGMHLLVWILSNEYRVNELEFLV
jgi:hypothetical protein